MWPIHHNNSLFFSLQLLSSEYTYAFFEMHIFHFIILSSPHNDKFLTSSLYMWYERKYKRVFVYKVKIKVGYGW